MRILYFYITQRLTILLTRTFIICMNVICMYECISGSNKRLVRMNEFEYLSFNNGSYVICFLFVLVFVYFYSFFFCSSATVVKNPLISFIVSSRSPSPLVSLCWEIFCLTSFGRFFCLTTSTNSYFFSCLLFSSFFSVLFLNNILANIKILFIVSNSRSHTDIFQKHVMKE